MVSKSSSVLMMFQADFRIRVLILARLGRRLSTSSCTSGKCLTIGGFLQCPPSSVKIQASGNIKLTNVKISYKLEFLDANWYADATLLLGSKPATCAFITRTRVVRSGVVGGRIT